MERKLIHGETIEQKLESVEAVLQSFRRRLSTKVIGYTMPIPVLASKDILGADGIVARRLIPFNGNLTDAYIHIGEMTVKEIIVTATLSTDIASSSVRVTINKPFQSFTLNFSITAGSLLVVSVNDPIGVKDVDIGFLVYPELSNAMNKETFLLEEILRLEVEEDAGIFRESNQNSSKGPSTIP